MFAWASPGVNIGAGWRDRRIRLTYFFFHIPKTGGTSFKRVLETWFDTERDEGIGREALRRLDKEQPGNLCIHGHFSGMLMSSGSSLLARYPWIVGNGRAQVFTLLRDPVEQAVSYYYHEVSAGRVNLPLSDFLRTPHAFAICRALEVNTAHELERSLESFACIGITEELQKSVDMMADRFGKPSAEVPHDRVGSRDAQSLSLSSADRSAIEQLYPMECEIYARARDALFGGKPIVWKPQEQFSYIRDRYSIRPSVGSPRSSNATARIVSFRAHGSDGSEHGRFDCREPIGLTIEFDVYDGSKTVEPAIRVTRQGHTVFVVAYVVEDSTPRPFPVGRHSATTWIPGNFLNPGPFEIYSNLANPQPVERFDQTSEPIVIEVVEADNPQGTARGSWRTPFPSGVRPLLKWTAG